MRFVARWIAPGARRIVEGSIEAADAAAARALLANQSLSVISLRRAPRSRGSSRRNADIDVASWCRELSTLLRAGMSVVECMETLALQANEARQSVQQGLLRELRAGASLSQAMQSSGLFPPLLVAGIRASEKTSSLGEALDEYLRYDESLRALKRQATSAAIYPSVVVLVGLGIATFLLTFVMPRFSAMYAGLHGQVSTVTQLMLWLSTALRQHGPLVMLVLLALAAIAVLAWRQGLLQRLGGSAVRAIPPLRRAATDFRRARLFQALIFSISGGYPLVEAMKVCESLGATIDPDGLLPAARAAIERGAPPSQAFAAALLVDEIGERLLRVGERGGQFEQVLRTLATRHSERFTLFVQRATRLVEPLLLTIVAVLVGGTVVMMYMPVFDAANGLK